MLELCTVLILTKMLNGGAQFYKTVIDDNIESGWTDHSIKLMIFNCYLSLT